MKYKLTKIGTHKTPQPQRGGLTQHVDVYHAELIDRNKYIPAGKNRNVPLENR